jgi:hypothetical protein
MRESGRKVEVDVMVVGWVSWVNLGGYIKVHAVTVTSTTWNAVGKVSLSFIDLVSSKGFGGA